MNVKLKGQIPKISAQMLVYSQDGSEMIFPCPNEQLQVGDLVLLEKGHYIPADTKILTGKISVIENNVGKIFEEKSIATGGLLIKEGRAKGYVFAKAEDSRLANVS